MAGRVSEGEKHRRRKTLYGLLSDLAARGAVCPVGEALAAAVGCPFGSVIEVLGQLVRDGLIESTTHRRHLAGSRQVTVFRVIRIVATGHVTGTPSRHADMNPPAPPRQLEQAKTFLRRKGPIVYDNNVVTGGPPGRLIRVDHQVCTPAEVIALAERMGFGGGSLCSRARASTGSRPIGRAWGGPRPSTARCRTSPPPAMRAASC